jgi:hypothetical protein
VGSLWILVGIGVSNWRSKDSFFSLARARMSEATSEAMRTGEHSIASTVILPASILERSSTSLMMLSRCSEFRRMTRV